MISAVLHSESVSNVAMSTEIRTFQSFLDRQIPDDYSLWYRIERLTELLQQCAEEQATTPQKDAILSLIPHLHNSMSQFMLAVGSRTTFMVI